LLETQHFQVAHSIQRGEGQNRLAMVSYGCSSKIVKLSGQLTVLGWPNAQTFLIDDPNDGTGGLDERFVVGRSSRDRSLTICLRGFRNSNRRRAEKLHYSTR
jgi:hypothetical protein